MVAALPSKGWRAIQQAVLQATGEFSMPESEAAWEKIVRQLQAQGFEEE